MINEKNAKSYCKDDISKIENYDKAIADTTQPWHCHHRLELTLDGEFALSRADLIRLNMYYNRPYFELIFLTNCEHHRLHGVSISDETRQKLSAAQKGENNPMYGKPGTNLGKTFSDEHRHKISESLKGKPLCEEHRQKLSEAHKGKTHSDEQRRKIAEAVKRSWTKRKTKTN